MDSFSHDTHFFVRVRPFPVLRIRNMFLGIMLSVFSSTLDVLGHNHDQNQA